jgi:hypothetical protein
MAASDVSGRLGVLGGSRARITALLPRGSCGCVNGTVSSFRVDFVRIQGLQREWSDGFDKMLQVYK